MKVSKYIASGIIQRSGTGAISVERYIVTPRSKLDGINDNKIQCNRFIKFGLFLLLSMSMLVSPFVLEMLNIGVFALEIQIETAQLIISARRKKYPYFQKTLCSASLKFGSSKNG